MAKERSRIIAMLVWNSSLLGVKVAKFSSEGYKARPYMLSIAK